MSERVALPCVPKVILAQHAVDLHIPPWVVDGMDGEAEEVHNEAEHVQVTIRRCARIEDKVRDVFIPAKGVPSIPPAQSTHIPICTC